MPRIGRPRSHAPLSGCGAPASYTDAGPPLKMRPRGLRAAISAAAIVPGTSSQYTPDSRTRRAISWLYCDPKSRMRTASWVTRTGGDSARGARAVKRSNPHSDALLVLLHLALRLDRRGDDHLGFLELGDRARAAHAHGALECANKVHAAVVDMRGPEEDLAQRAARPSANARAARQVRIRRGHAPVVAVARGLGSRPE